ncbi:chlorite dismutase family protein [Aquihabitans sp. McL0605]|uniref:chlorite dismutase family protein n=1 Tax=Aquihabitans sp. McL0605 TaxID=3415671 RepID=UPI003CFB81CF
MPEPLESSIGVGVLHLFCTVGEGTDRAAIEAAVKAAQADDLQVVPVAVLGHKADIAFMALGKDWWRLKSFQTALSVAGLTIIDSYLSMTELSEYAQGLPEQMANARLYPVLPPDGMSAWCFYPMSKKRERKANWFTLPYDERKELMMEHGASGRKFAGRIVQLITGSAGVDDYEWGVTLFAQKPDDLKEVVYKMRFDEASAKYADFGQFISGAVGSLTEVLDAAGVPD